MKFALFDGTLQKMKFF